MSETCDMCGRTIDTSVNTWHKNQIWRTYYSGFEGASEVSYTPKPGERVTTTQYHDLRPHKYTICWSCLWRELLILQVFGVACFVAVVVVLSIVGSASFSIGNILIVLVATPILYGIGYSTLQKLHIYNTIDDRLMEKAGKERGGDCTVFTESEFKKLNVKI